MRSIIFTEEFCQPEELFPLSLTRQVQDCRVGILTIREKWEKLTSLPVALQKEGEGIVVPANIIPSRKNFEAIFLTTENKNDIMYCVSIVVMH